jgi:hypothetical protein
MVRLPQSMTLVLDLRGVKRCFGCRTCAKGGVVDRGDFQGANNSFEMPGE